VKSAQFPDDGNRHPKRHPPGDLGWLISLHGEAYEGEAGPYGVAFEAHVAGTIAEFMIDNGGRGEVFFAEEETGALVGTAAGRAG